ncbi:MAG: SURF1 family protein [Pseudomonadota bacterium]
MRYIFALLLGALGMAALVSLGVWQLQRLEWKEAILNDVAQRMTASPVVIPALPTELDHEYLRVKALGRVAGPELHVLTSEKFVGPGFLVLRRFDMADGRSILVDLGFVVEAEKTAARPEAEVAVTGNLLWPNEVDPLFTPDPNRDRNIWFARDLPVMAEALGTEPLLLVASGISPDLGTRPVPVAANVPNDHLEYAITWFSLAAVWLAMTLYLIWRIRRRTA